MNKAPRMSCKKKPDPNKEDFKLELAFAKKYLRGEVNLEDFTYWKSYVSTLDKERKYISGEVLVVGCGPLPLSVFMASTRADGLDKSKRAVNYANKVWHRYRGKTDYCAIHSNAEDFDAYRHYDSILLTLEAGTTLKKKRKILNVIHSHIQGDAFLIMRSSKTPEFVQVEEAIDASQWIIVDRFDVFDGLSTSFVLQKR